jgi:Fe-Mn family superoxide dismutase
MPYEVPPLPYDYGALEPHIDEQTMRLHHDKHHQTYVDKANAALDGTEWVDRPIEEVLQSLDRLPEDKRTIVRNNGGGHYNHTLFWEIMGAAGGEPTGEIADAIEQAFGTFDAFKEEFSTAATNHFGSGWAWLVGDGTSVTITTTPNQDSPIMQGQTPILGIDVWEHAYYLDYENRRPEYVAAFLNHLVNWEAVEANLQQAL